jgi:hypothetical protein
MTMRDAFFLFVFFICPVLICECVAAQSSGMTMTSTEPTRSPGQTRI